MRTPSAALALVGRAGLADVRLHGEPLHRHALRALAEAIPGRVDVVVDEGDVGRTVGRRGRVLTVAQWWAGVRTAGRPVLVHDPLCPLVGATFLAEVAGRDATTTSHVAVRPVTDTVKTVVEERIAGTVDRDTLAALASPTLLSESVVAASERPPPLHDPAGLVGWLAARGPLELVRAPMLGRRVDDVSAVNLLECLDQIERRTRH